VLIRLLLENGCEELAKYFRLDGRSHLEAHIVTAKYPNQLWHVDLTVAPTDEFWTSGLWFALP
jgi:hypothetical protein